MYLLSHHCEKGIESLPSHVIHVNAIFLVIPSQRYPSSEGPEPLSGDATKDPWHRSSQTILFHDSLSLSLSQILGLPGPGCLAVTNRIPQFKSPIGTLGPRSIVRSKTCSILTPGFDLHSKSMPRFGCVRHDHHSVR